MYSYLNEMKEIFDAIGVADIIVLYGPCYVNTYPADTVRLLEELAARPDILHGQKLYGVIQGGMPYAHTHVSGLNMLKLFSNKVNISYQGGFVMGFGAMLDGRPLTNLTNGKTVERQLTAFFEHIHKGENSPDSVYEAALMKIPAFVTGILAVYMRRKIKKSMSPAE